MCGIAGIIGIENQEVSSQKVGKMLDSLKHRGPNDVGLEIFDNAVLGHRRLSIFDLSLAGHQPMISSDGETAIVFNGAIYNFLELRKELETKNYTFKSQTDTEVLLHGFRAWGIELLVKKIEGMFAFGIWDNQTKTFHLVRDRLGVKPLAFAIKNKEIAFASTVRALKRAGYGNEISSEGIAEYLEFGFLTDKTAIFQGIEKLPAATILTWQNGNVKTQTYWDLPIENDNKISFEDAVAETERLFLESVKKRLQADVSIGALLSGGIDSTLVCWAIAKLGGDVTAFTVGVPNDKWDESNVAKETAQKLGIKHQILEMSAEKPFNVDILSEAYPEPFACASALGLLDISKLVSQNATVLLTGDGGDDVFLGYPEHKHFWMAEKIADKTPAFVSNVWQKSSSIMPKKGLLKRANSFLSYSFGGLGAITQARDGLPIYEKNGLLGERLQEINFSHRNIPFTSGRNLLREFLEYDRETRFIGEYLPKVDGGTMFYALEARSPFLDTKLWEFANKLPYSIRLNQKTLKAVLREIVKRRISPELAAAKKQGFGVPVQRWLTDKWRNNFVEILEDSVLEKEGWINSKKAIELLDKVAKENWSPRQLWFILVLESWLRFEKNNG